MMKVTFFPTVLSLTVLTFYLIPLSAEEINRKDKKDEKVLVQPYYAYDAWQKLKLSSAYFVNPQAADRADVSIFIPLEDLNEEERRGLVELVGQGKAEFSVKDDQGIFYKIIGNVQDPNSISNIDDIGAWGAAAVGVIGGRRIGDEYSGIEVISWGEKEFLEK